MSTTLVYGASPYGYLTLVPEGALEEAAAKILPVLAAKTYGEARAIDAPGADDEEMGNADPYDVREMGFVADGDWPPNAGMVALQTLSGDVRALVATERSMVGQEWVEFDAADEQRVVDAVTALGYSMRRDDAAIQAFDTLLEA